MQSESEYIKIAVQIENAQHLHKINKAHSLSDIINDICSTYQKDNSNDKYGLQFIFASDNKNLVKKYVTEKNLSEIKDGYIVSLVSSLSNVLNWIFSNTNEIPSEKLKHLPDLCNDPAALQEMKLRNYHNVILRTARKLYVDDLYICLKAVSNMFGNNIALTIESQFFDFLLDIVKSATYPNHIIVIVLQLLSQILILNYNSTFTTSKLNINDIAEYLVSEKETELQLYSLKLINNIIRKFDDVKDVLPDLMLNKDKIFKHVTDNAALNLRISYELCVYQSFLLNAIYSDASKEFVNTEDDYSDILRCKDEVLNSVRRDTLIDFDEKDIRDKIEISSNLSTDLFRSSSKEDYLDSISMISTLEQSTITKLTSMCIEYYKRKYEKNFNMSLLETRYSPGFYQVCDQIVQMLCDILYINKPPDSNAKLYIPIIFGGYLSEQFFEELFCRAVWLLAKTRREMKAKFDDDHTKVLAVLKQQFFIALHKRPMRFKELTEELKNISYKHVFEIWDKERNKKWDIMLQNNPSLITVKNKLLPDIQELIREQRLNILKRGEIFPKLPEKRGRQLYWYISLIKNNTKLQFGDFDPDTGKFTSAKTVIHISKIENIATGKASKCVKENKVRRLELIPRCFTLYFSDDQSLDFLACDILTAQYWIDGLSFLLDKPIESKNYKNDLEMLLKMELNIHLLELQNIPVPKSAPPVPPLPLELRIKPQIPAKSDQLMQRVSYRRKNSNNNELN